MKKLMIVAALAAAVSANAELCVETGTAAGCSVYNVKFSLKTLAGKKSECGNVLLANQGGGVWTRYVGAGDAAVIAAGAAVGDPVANLTQAQLTAGAALWTGTAYPGSFRDRELETRRTFWMDNATRTWEGVLWQCEANCVDPNTAGSRAMFVMWEKKAKRAMSFPAFRAYNAVNAAGQRPYRWFSVNYDCNDVTANPPNFAKTAANEVPNFWFLGRYGQKATKVAVGWNPTVYPTYGFHAAGFGTFYSKDNVHRMTSVSGNCVGLIAPLVAGAEDDCGNDTRIFAQVAYVCQKFKMWCCDPCYYATFGVPASGTWSLKYNASLSKGTKPLSSIIPDYAVFSSDNYTAANIAALNAAIAGALTPDPVTLIGGGTVAFDNQGILVKTPAAAPVGDTATLTDAELDEVARRIAPAFQF